MRPLPYILFLLVHITVKLIAQPLVQLKATTDSTSYYRGDRIDVNIELRTDVTPDSIAPMLQDSIGSFEVLHIDHKAGTPRWTIYVTTTDSGRILFPPIPFRYYLKGDTTRLIAYTNPLFLTMRGININLESDIKDIKPPLSAPLQFEDLLPYIIALVIIAVMVAGWYYYRKYKQKKRGVTEETIIIIPPHKEALAALRRLEEKKLWQQGFIKEYYSELTDILRLFIEKRLDIMALEITTDELLDQMKKIPEALLLWNDLEWSLRTADLVKFAKHLPTPQENEKIMTIAYTIVRTMSPKEEPQTIVQQEEMANVR